LALQHFVYRLLSFLLPNQLRQSTERNFHGCTQNTEIKIIYEYESKTETLENGPTTRNAPMQLNPQNHKLNEPTKLNNYRNITSIYECNNSYKKEQQIN